MTAKARQLGMSRTVFVNASGLPDGRKVTTARDMSTLAIALMKNYPNEYRLFSTASFNFRGRTVQRIGVFGGENLAGPGIEDQRSVAGKGRKRRRNG
ncbi:hypothetical protein AB9F35_33645, partial [Rhizobium leguminosarum]